MAIRHCLANVSRRLVVVDPQLDDYNCLTEPVRKGVLRVTLTTTGSNALRLAPAFADALWLVTPQLPDMNGLDLLDMLHSLQHCLVAVVVDSEYDAERELRTLQSHAVQYVCKPLQVSWIYAWQEALASPKKKDMSAASHDRLISVHARVKNQSSFQASGESS